MKQKFLTTFCLCCILLTACDKNTSSPNEEQGQTNGNNPPPANNSNGNNTSGNCISYSEASVVQVTGPTSANINTEVTLQVKFGVQSGCGNFGRFEKTETDFNHMIAVIAKYEGCLCTANAPVRTVNYVFKASTPGIYYLKFKKSPTQNSIHQITVQAAGGN